MMYHPDDQDFWDVEGVEDNIWKDFVLPFLGGALFVVALIGAGAAVLHLWVLG